MTTPAAMTYDSLVADIQTYAERSDQPFVDQIPRFIMLAENRIASEIHGLGFVRVVDGNLTASNPVVEKPQRWRETKSFLLPDLGRYLFKRSLEYCEIFGATDDSGVPRYYADYDYEHFYVTGVPDSNHAFRLRYHERPEPLSTANQTSWTTRYAPQLLLYATLLEAQPFLKLAERITEFQGLFDRAAAALSAENALNKSDSSSGEVK